MIRREDRDFHRTHPIPTMKLIFATFASALCVGGSSAFVVNQRSAGGAVSHRPLTPSSPSSPTCSSTALNMGGFGGGGGMGKKGGKKGGKKSGGGGGSAPLKLKAKAQWDRYCDKLKGAKIFPVAVRVVNGEERGEWLEIGRVKSEGDEFTEVAVAMQRGLIAEHAKRLMPLQVKPKDMVEWAFGNDDDEEPSWSIVDKSVCDGAPKGVDKKIGFEGTPDPNSGFYCHYSGGRLVDKSDKAKQMAKSG